MTNILPWIAMIPFVFVMITSFIIIIKDSTIFNLFIDCVIILFTLASIFGFVWGLSEVFK